MTYKKRTSKRQSSNPSGLAKIWPSDIEDYRLSLLARFKTEYGHLHGPEREKKRQAFMARHFYNRLKPDKIFSEVGLAVADLVKRENLAGDNPKDKLAEILNYIREDT